MSSFKQKLKKLYRLDFEIDISLNLISSHIENKLGDGWGITQQTDGLCLIDKHSNNYAVPMKVLIHVMDLPREESLIIIDKYSV